MSDLISEFNDYREKKKKKLLADDNKVIKRIVSKSVSSFDS